MTNENKARPSPAPVKSVGEDDYFCAILGKAADSENWNPVFAHIDSLLAARTVADAPKRETDSPDRIRSLFLSCMKDLGLSDGEPGWIQHDDGARGFVKDGLTVEGEIIFGFEAIADHIKELKAAPVAADQPAHDVSVRDAALEEAAIICDAERAEYMPLAGEDNGRNSDFAFGSVISAERIAAAIRALRSQPEQKGDSNV